MQQRDIKKSLGLQKQPVASLMPFDGSSHTNIHSASPFTREDYFDLVDKTGRFIREGKRGFIPAELPPIIIEFGINPDKWIEYVKYFGRRYASCAENKRTLINLSVIGYVPTVSVNEVVQNFVDWYRDFYQIK